MRNRIDNYFMDHPGYIGALVASAIIGLLLLQKV